MKFSKSLITTAILGFSLASFHSTAWADTLEQQFQQGFEAATREDYQTAFKLWLPLAEQGNAKAQVLLGLAYLLGKGVQFNKSLAKEWFYKACDNGEKIGCKYYGELNRGER